MPYDLKAKLLDKISTMSCHLKILMAFRILLTRSSTYTDNFTDNFTDNKF